MPETISHILTIGLPILVLFYCAACAAALRPRTGTLAWISACDRPTPPVIGCPHPAEKKDLLPLAGICVLTCLLRIAGTMRPLSVSFSLPAVQLGPALLECAGEPLAAAVLSYLLMKHLFGQTFSAALCAALVAADLSSDPVSLAFSAASLFCLVRYLTAPEEPSFRQTLIPLAGGFVLLAAGCYFAPALLPMLAAAVFLCVMGCVDRFVMTGKLWLFPCLGTAFISAALTWIAVFIPAGMWEGYEFPSMLAVGGYYLMVLQRLGSGIAALFHGGLTAFVPDDWPLLLAAFPALVSAVVWMVRDHSRRSIVILVWFVMQCLTFILLGNHALSLGCAVCLCQVWSRLEENRFLWLACVGAGALFVLLLMQTFLIL